MCEIEIEEIPGLPGKLPEGERLLWQGRPSWQSLARRCFKLRWVAAYFAVFGSWWSISAFSDNATLGAALLEGLMLLPIAALALGLLCGLAWLTARTTIYSITSRRVAIRFGIALPMTINLPFSRIGSADLKSYDDASGDIMLSLLGRDRLAYLHLWPHARPWCFTRVQPMLRGLPQVQEAGRILADALAVAVAERQAAERMAASETTACEPAPPRAGRIRKASARRQPALPAGLPVAAAE
ncbi:photosynthetic complex putative assembly protein PuhB [Algihabitans albus]|uniref:photosynthetic complex putative assembly protein PuhB n=1 Tax=Algihabitans albus TaxID=2164067 RepID=UPI0013C3500E|nr:photosynthetic complex putative assembly protein PuhB [Algihabitans albus]